MTRLCPICHHEPLPGETWILHIRHGCVPYAEAILSVSVAPAVWWFLRGR